MAWSDPIECEENMICEDGSCSVPQICETNERECVSETEYRICGDNAWNETQSCKEGDVCNVGYCHKKDEDTAETDIGSRCSCSGNCTITISKSDLDKLINTTVMKLLGTFLNINDDDKITMPNFFSSKISGCKNITAPEGMDVGCFYTSQIQASKSFADIPALLLQIKGWLSLDYPDNFETLLQELATTLSDGVQFKADEGYCMIANIDSSIILGESLLARIFDQKEFNTIVDRINTPNHAPIDSETVSCPEGSSHIWFNLADNSDYADTQVGFDLCLKSCHTDDDCRTEDGYSCVTLPHNYAEIQAGQETWSAHVCFDQTNIDYFSAMSEDFKKAANPD